MRQIFCMRRSQVAVLFICFVVWTGLVWLRMPQQWEDIGAAPLDRQAFRFLRKPIDAPTEAEVVPVPAPQTPSPMMRNTLVANLSSPSELLNVDHGAWILPKKSLPRMRRAETPEEFNERLVTAIIEELSRAWPPRVVLPFARALAAKVFALRLDNMKEEKKPAKVAFLFLVGGDISTESLWRAFFLSDFAKERSKIVVHPPPLFELPEGSFFAPYVVPHDRRVKVTWGSLAMVKAEVILVATALQDPAVQRFVLLSETDVPLWPYGCVYEALMSTKNVSYLETRETLERAEMFDFPWREAKAIMNAEDPDRRRRPADPDAEMALKHWRKGSQWFALSREHAEIVTKRGRLKEWYDAHARRQLRRDKVKKMGPWAALVHIADKANFADEHFVQTTLARNGGEEDLLAASLTFATFGKSNEFTVWGDGLRHDFRLDAAEWHAVQFGALDVRALDAFHRLCRFDHGATGPLPASKPELELKRRANRLPVDPDAVMRDILANKTTAQEAGPPRRTNPPRIVVEEYSADKLRCSLESTPMFGDDGRSSPCYLFARKIHPEAVDYYGQLLATYFLEKADPQLAGALGAARRLQRASAAQEISRVLAGHDVNETHDYAVRDMHSILAALAATTLFDGLPHLDIDGLVKAAAKVDRPPTDDDATRLANLVANSLHELPDASLNDFMEAVKKYDPPKKSSSKRKKRKSTGLEGFRDFMQAIPLPEDPDNPDTTNASTLTTNISSSSSSSSSGPTTTTTTTVSPPPPQRRRRRRRR